MRRFFLSLFLTAAAFAAAWWAGSVAPLKQPAAPGPPAATAADSVSGGPGDSRLTFGFAHREARLQRLEITDIPSIRRLLETSQPDAEAMAGLIRVWAEQEPAGLWQWLENGGRKTLGGQDVTSTVFDIWFRQDPEAAIAAFRNTDQERRGMAAFGLLRCLLSSGADAGLTARLAPYLDEIVAAGPYLIGNFGGGTEKDTISLLEKLPPGSGRDTLLSATAQGWLEKDWKAASAWVSGLTEPLKSKIMGTVALTALSPGPLTADGLSDAQAGAQAERFDWAAQWFTTEAPADLRRKLGPQYLDGLARNDPAAALEWAQDNLTSRPLAKAIGGVLREQAQRDPAAARALVESLPPGGLRQRAAFAVVTKADAESVTWLMGQTGTRDAGGWNQLAADWSFTDPAAYRKFVEATPPDALPPALVSSGMDNLVRKDAPGTMDWALGTGNPRAAGAALESWGRNDQPAAAAWLKEHSARDFSAHSVDSFAGHYFHTAPNAAADWAVSLPPSPVRDTTMAAMRRSLTDYSGFKPEQRSALEARLSGKP